MTTKTLVHFKNFGDIKEKTDPKPFTIKMPVSAAKQLRAMDSKERMILMRSAIIKALSERSVVPSRKCGNGKITEEN